MTDQSQKFRRQTLLDFDKCICSPESPDGQKLSGSPKSQKTKKSGRSVAPANRSRSQAKAKQKTTSDTSGQKPGDSSPSVGLQCSSANKSPVNRGGSGYRECVTTCSASKSGDASTKTCTACKSPQPKENFRKYSGRSSDGLRPICKVCQRKYEANWNSNNKERRQAVREKRSSKEKEYRQTYDAKNRGKLLIMEAKRRSARKRIPFDLDKHIPEFEARIAKGECEMTGLPFNLHSRGISWNSPSLDRMNPKAGYVRDNVRIVCFAMNAAMGTWGEVMLTKIMTAWKERK